MTSFPSKELTSLLTMDRSCEPGPPIWFSKDLNMSACLLVLKPLPEWTIEITILFLFYWSGLNKSLIAFYFFLSAELATLKLIKLAAASYVKSELALPSINWVKIWMVLTSGLFFIRIEIKLLITYCSLSLSSLTFILASSKLSIEWLGFLLD